MNGNTDHSSRINLKDTFPVSSAFIMRRNLRYLCALLAFAAVFFLLFTVLEQLDKESFGDIREFLTLKKILFGSVLAGILIVRLVYDFLYWIRYDYYIERNRLHIESGVVMRQEASVPLTPLCEFYLEKRWVDLLFGTKDLVMKAVIGEGQEVCRIRALKESHAKSLKRFLIKQGELASTGIKLPTAKTVAAA